MSIFTTVLHIFRLKQDDMTLECAGIGLGSFIGLSVSFLDDDELLVAVVAFVVAPEPFASKFIIL